MITFRKMEKADVSFMVNIRNECCEYLHTNEKYNQDEAISWYKKTKPLFFIIIYEGEDVGYFRTSKLINDSVCIGADIHKDYRNMGIAQKAYPLFIDFLTRIYYLKRCWLEVLETNKRAMHLYKKLGFVVVGDSYIERDNKKIKSIKMEMRLDTIQIGIACNENSIPYLDFLLKTIDRTISAEYPVEFIIGKNESFDFDSNIFDEYGFEYTIIDVIPNKNNDGDQGHGYVLNKILSEMDSKYGIFIDADTAFLCDDWDKLMINELNDDCPIIGTAYQETPKNKNKGNYQNNPNVIFCMFDVNVMNSMKIDFRRKLSAGNVNIVAVDDKIKKICLCADHVTYLSMDTGYQIPYKLHEYNKKGKILNCVVPPKLKRVVDIKGVQEYFFNDELILTHSRLSSSRSFYSKDVQSWKNNCLDILNEVKHDPII